MVHSEGKAREWQFSIRHLLALTTIIALASVEPSILAAFIYVLFLCSLVGLCYFVGYLISRLLLWLFP
jgi:hypothetical protein